jgi:hypothetical protein
VRSAVRGSLREANAERHVWAERFTLDRPLILALLPSANGSPQREGKSKGAAGPARCAPMEEEINRAKDVLREIMVVRTEARR